MAKGYRTSGIDFDDLFDPDVMGDGPSVGNLRMNGAALRYAALKYGAKRADVGYRQDGIDVSNLWAAKGTAVYVITGLHGKHLYASDGALTNQPNVSAQVYVSLSNNGTWGVGGSTSRGSFSQNAPTSGTWLPSGAAVSDYQAQFVVTSSGTGQQNVYNGAPAYAALTTARGVTLSLPSYNAANGDLRTGSADVTIYLKRISTGTVSITRLSMDVETLGYA
jgi:hypothetical protein